MNKIKLKTVKFAKTGNRYILTIPTQLIKNEIIDPDCEYDVELKPIKKEVKPIVH